MSWISSVVSKFRSGRALSYSFLALGVVQSLNVVTGIVLARSLGPSGRGVLAAVMLWPVVLAGVGSLGITEAITYKVARSRSTDALVGSSLAIAGIQSVGLVALGVVVLPLLLSRHAPQVVATGRVFLVYIPLYLTAMYLMSILNGQGRVAAFHGLRAFVVGASALGLVILALAGRLTVVSAASVYLAAHLGALVGGVLAVRASTLKALRVDATLSKELLNFGVRSHTGNMASLLNERLDQLVIAVLLAPASLGLYVVAVTLTSLTVHVGSSISLVALPSIAASRGQLEARENARLYLWLGLMLSVAVTFPLVLLTPFLIDVLFGQAFRGAVAPARILLVASVGLSVSRVLGAVLRGLGSPLDAGVAEVFALGVTVIALAALLPVLGLVGAALASLAAYAASFVWMVWRAARTLSMPLGQFFSIPWRVRAGLVRAG